MIWDSQAYRLAASGLRCHTAHYAKCLDAQDSLAVRIAEYRPLAIVSLLISIKTIVDAAAIAAGSDAPRFAVPFPGMGQQPCFQAAMGANYPNASEIADVVLSVSSTSPL